MGQQKRQMTKPKKSSHHPAYFVMIKRALKDLKDVGGSSRQALLKYIQKNFCFEYGTQTINRYLKQALRTGVKNGTLVHTTGSGAAGSFRLGELKKAKQKRKGTIKVALKRSGQKHKKSRGRRTKKNQAKSKGRAQHKRKGSSHTQKKKRASQVRKHRKSTPKKGRTHKKIVPKAVSKVTQKLPLTKFEKYESEYEKCESDYGNFESEFQEYESVIV